MTQPARQLPQQSIPIGGSGDTSRFRAGLRASLFALLFLINHLSPVRLYAEDPALEDHFYDKVILNDGKVYYADPKWSGSEQRPLVRLEILERLNFAPHDRKETKKYVNCDPADVSEIQYWEARAIWKIKSYIAENNYAAAKKLHDKLQQWGGGWNATQLTETRDMVELAEIRDLCSEGKSQLDRQRGLSKLEQIAKDRPRMAHLEIVYRDIYLDMAWDVYQQGNYRQTRDYLTRIGDTFGSSKDLDEAWAIVRRDARVHLDRAQALESQGRLSSSLESCFKALEIDPSDAGANAMRRRLMSQYQVLNVASYEKPGTFEPCNATRPLERQITSLIFDRLVEPDEEGRKFFKGPLTDSFIPKSLGKVFEFELNASISFADGKSLSAQDVADTIRLLKNPSREAFDPEWDKYVQRVDVLEPHRLAVHIRQHPRPESLFTFPVLPGRFLRTVPQRGDSFSTHPVGSGPFVVSTPDRQGNVRLAANPRYRGRADGLPYIKEITFPYYVQRGAGAADDDLQKGRVHVITDPSPVQLIRLQAASHLFRTRPFQSNSVWVLAFNYRNPLFQNKEAREAVLWAVSRERILNQYFKLGGGGQFSHEVISGPFPPQSPAADPTIAPRKPSPTVARQLVRRLGNAAQGTLRLKYANNNDLRTEQAMVQIKKDLEAVGLNVRIDPKLPNDFVKEVARDHDFDLAYWKIDHNILYNIAGLFDISDEALAKGGSNFMGYQDQSLNQLFVDLRHEQVGDRIWATQHRIHRYIHDNVIVVPLWRLDSYVIYTTRLKGRSGGKTHELPIDQNSLFRRTEQWFLQPD